MQTFKELITFQYIVVLKVPAVPLAHRKKR